MSKNVDRARAILLEARAQLGSDRHVDAEVFACQQRLNRPLRVALVGSSDSQKSTLVDALVGDQVAQPSSSRSGRVSTWFSRAREARIDVITDDGLRTEVPVTRRAGRVAIDLDSTSVDRIERIHVQWPSPFLGDYTVIDAPALPAGGSGLVSERVLARLGQADVIVHVATDGRPDEVEVLETLQHRLVGVMGVVGVVTSSPHRPGNPKVHVISPVMALRGRTLSPSDFITFTQLTAIPGPVLHKMLVSESGFGLDHPTVPLSAAERHSLVKRFGVDGIRIALAGLAAGIDDAAALGDELVRRSGLERLRHSLQSEFGARHEQLAVHASMQSLRRVLERRATAQSMYLLSDVDRLLGGDHSFHEFEALTVLRSGQLNVTEWQRNALEQALGGLGASNRARLGLEPDTAEGHMVEVAQSAARYWRAQLDNPVLDAKRERAYAIAARSCEAILTERSLVHF